MKKLNDYVEKKGLRKDRFAEKLGMRPQVLYDILLGKRQIPKKYWKKIIDETGGEITMNDLVEYFLSDVEDSDNEKETKS